MRHRDNAVIAVLSRRYCSASSATFQLDFGDTPVRFRRYSGEISAILRRESFNFEKEFKRVSHISLIYSHLRNLRKNALFADQGTVVSEYGRHDRPVVNNFRPLRIEF